jgi:hypothetical protein
MSRDGREKLKENVRIREKPFKIGYFNGYLVKKPHKSWLKLIRLRFG